MKVRIPSAPRNDGLRVHHPYSVRQIARRFGWSLSHAKTIAALAGLPTEPR
jgi:hypothetical protein